MNNNTRDVVVVGEDGHVTIVSQADVVLKTEFELRELLGSVKVLAAQCLTTLAAQSSIFKSRPDLASNIHETDIVLIAAYALTTENQHDSSSLHVGIWSFNSEMPLKAEATVHPIVTHKLELHNVKAAGRRFVFGVDARKLEICDNLSTTTFDLTTVTPQRLSSRKHMTPDQTSEIELTNNIHLSISQGLLQIYNTKFNSLLASTSLSRSMLKRKRNEPAFMRLSTLAYFAQLRRVVASDGTSLFSIDILADSAMQNPFKKSSMLIGNILRGAQDTHSPSRPGKAGAKQDFALGSSFTNELDELVTKNDVGGFQKKLLQILEVDSFNSLKRTKVSSKMLDYLLNKMFKLETTGSSDKEVHKLKAVFLVPALIEWLAINGLLVDYHVFKAVKANTATNVRSTGEVAEALLATGLDLSVVQCWISKSPILEPAALSLVIKSLLTKALAQSNEHMQATLAYESRSGVDEPTFTQELVIGAGPDELTVSTTTTICLAHALKRLALAGPVVVSKQLRKVFMQQELLALIQFLRQQLYLGGFTRLANARKYPSPPSSVVSDVEDYNTNPNPQISLNGIVVLLNACIDALGPVGILGSEEHEEFIQNLLPDLLSEITSAMQAVEESTLLQGLVRETLRYVESVERQPFEVRSKMQKDLAKSTRKGEIVTIYAEPDSEEAGVIAGSALPLSLKAEEDIDSFKVRKGGGQVSKRSTREMGMLKDRLRSSYSFERLIL